MSRRPRPIALLAVLLLVCASPASARQNGSGGAAGGPSIKIPVDASKVRVVCVGVNTYLPDCAVQLDSGARIDIFLNLKFAEADAKAMERILRDRYGYDVRPAVLGADATRQRIMEELDWLAGAESDGAAIFYFSGHGTTAEGGGLASKRGAFVVPSGSKLSDKVRKDLPDAAPAPAEGEKEKPALPAETRLRVPARADALTYEILDDRTIAIQDIVQKLRGGQMKHSIIIIDACCAGYQLDGALTAPDVSSKGGSYFDETMYGLFAKKSATIYTAGTDVQEAHESPIRPEDKAIPYLCDAEGHGWFTAELLRELAAVPAGHAVITPRLHMNVMERVHARSGGLTGRREMLPRTVSAGEGSFAWVAKPPDEWLAKVLQQMQEHKKPQGGGNRGGPAGMPTKDEGPAPIDAAASELDLLCVAIKAAQIRSGKSKEDGRALVDDPRWKDWQDRCVLGAAAGDPKAMSALYFAYGQGITVARNDRIARSWAKNGADSKDSTAQDIFEFAILYGGNVAEADKQNRDEAKSAQTTMALGGVVVALQGAEQGDEAALGAGVAAAVLGFTSLLQEPRLVDKINSLGKSREVLNTERRAVTRPRDLAVMKAAVEQIKVIAQELGSFAKSDQVSSAFKRLMPCVAIQLKSEANALGKALGTGQPDEALYRELDRRLEETLALYTERCMVIEAEKKRLGGPAR